DDFLILNVVGACVKNLGTVYYALDHRRLKGLKEAGCARVRIRLAHDALEEFVRKASDKLGLRRDILVRKSKKRPRDEETPLAF
ncbi:unnamed protein product, partial [Polarella glacialis]